MRRLLFVAVGLLGLANAGCFVNAYSPDPVIRMNQLINQSENLRQIGIEVNRFWMTDQPSHLTSDRVDGGVYP